MFPVDTVKTLMQTRGIQSYLHAQALTANSAGGRRVGMSTIISHLRTQGGMPRMWRGVQTMFSGCVPAHAAYFSIYEGCKMRLSTPQKRACPPAAGGGSVSTPLPSSTAAAAVADDELTSGHDAMAAGVSVALATIVHDLIMTPFDCIKQRLQLGYHRNSVVECACHIVRQEGFHALVCGPGIVHAPTRSRADASTRRCAHAPMRPHAHTPTRPRAHAPYAPYDEHIRSSSCVDC